MGCVGSKEKKKPRLPMQEFEMDSHEDSEHGGSTAEDVISEKWRHTPHKALNQFLRESSNESLFSGDLFDYFQDDEFVELRTLLDEPLGRSHFLAHVAHYSQDDVNLVRVWLLLHQYHHMESNDSERYEAAKNLYKHYFQISQERKQAAEAFKAEKIEAGEFETDENRDSADDGEDDGDDGSGSRSSSKLSRKKSNASESGSVCSIPPVESAKNQYQRKLVPEECSNFPIKVVKVISSLRPTVELALIDAHEKFSGNGGKKLSSNLQSNNNNNETNGNLPPSSPSSSSSSSPTAKKDNSSSHDNDSATGSPNSNPSKIVQMVNNDLSTEDRVVAVRKYSSSLGQLVDIAPDGGIGVSEVKLNGSNLIANKLDSKTLPNNIDRVPPLYLFIDLQNEVFKEMRPLYLHFKETSEDYEAFQKSKKLWYNHVEADDFTYIDKLGAGGFGNVVHVIRKSTGKHYAMKVQAKDTLVTTWSGKIQHVEIERDVLVANRKFDFIVSLRYAFQSDRYAFLVLDLAENGSLRQLLEDSPGFQLELPQVRLYVAEIVLALECLHDHEIIYRDLKPENVLLCADGHIMLADMGLAGFYYQDKYHEDDYAEFGIQHKSALEAQEEDDSLFEDSDVETDGDKDTSGGGTASGETATSDDATAAASSAGMTTSSTKTTDGNDDDDDDSECRPDKIKRVKTIKSHDTDCGTPLYRAPEMIAAEKNNGHYNEGVDWFMLGVFTFECLVGHLPFEPKTKGITDSGMIEIETDEQELRLLRRKVIIPPHLGDATKDLLTGLLDLNPETRLGAGPSDLNRDMEALKGHRFFVPLAGPLATELDWEKVSKKEYAPLYVPKPKELNEKPKYSSFESLVKDWRKTAKREAKQYAKRRNIKTNYNIQALTEGQALDAESEKYFDNWDYIDPETINLEKVAEQERKEEDAAPGRLKSIRRDLGLSIRGKINKKKKKKKK